MSNSIECIVSIIERGKHDPIIKVIRSQGCLPYLQFVANGTASSELLDLAGIGTSKRDVIVSIGERDTVHNLMSEIKNRDKLKLHTNGIVFSVKVNGLSALLAKNAFEIAKQDVQEMNIMNYKDSLILVSLNQGYTDEVMATAKKYGAKGGTVMKANWTDAQQIENKYGVTLHKEKEILAIVASNDIRKDIMDHIHEEHGINTRAQAMVMSLPVTDKAIL